MDENYIEFICLKCGATYFTIGNIPEFKCNCDGRKFKEK